MKFDVSTVAAKVTAPTLVTQYQNDQFFPGGGRQVYDLLTCQKAIRLFTAAEGANLHCAPLAPQRRNQVVFDWLTSVLRIPRS